MSEEDRLIQVGWAMCVARDIEGDALTRTDADKIIEQEAQADQGSLSQDIRRRFIELGRKDPRPYMERLKQSCLKLLELCQSQEEEKRLVEQMQSTLDDLALVLLVRRYGGRPKGKGKKIKPEDMEKIHVWMKGRKKGSKPTAAEFAKQLQMSRQTLHTLIKKIEAEEKENLICE